MRRRQRSQGGPYENGVRGFRIAYGKRKAKNKRDEEKKLQAQLNELLSRSEKCKNNPQLRGQRTALYSALRN